MDDEELSVTDRGTLTAGSLSGFGIEGISFIA